jgi:hypothetical protein
MMDADFTAALGRRCGSDVWDYQTCLMETQPSHASVVPRAVTYKPTCLLSR